MNVSKTLIYGSTLFGCIMIALFCLSLTDGSLKLFTGDSKADSKLDPKYTYRDPILRYYLFQQFFPRWKPRFSCKTYSPKLRLDGVETKKFTGISGTHDTLLHSKEFGGVIVKPEQRHSCEIMFFEHVYNLTRVPFSSREEEDKSQEEVNQLALRELAEEFLPTYYGCFKTEEKRWHAVTEDVTRGFVKPSIADFTIQPRQYGPSDTFVVKGISTALEKKSRHSKHQYLVVDFTRMRRAWSSMTDDDVAACLRAFFYDGKRLRIDVVEAFIPLVERLKELISTQNYYIFADSSLLFIYETDQAALRQNEKDMKEQELEEASKQKAVHYPQVNSTSLFPPTKQEEYYPSKQEYAPQGAPSTTSPPSKKKVAASAPQPPPKVKLRLIDFDEATPYWGDDSGQQKKHLREPSRVLKSLIKGLKAILKVKVSPDGNFESLDEVVNSCPSMEVQSQAAPKRDTFYALSGISAFVFALFVFVYPLHKIKKK